MERDAQIVKMLDEHYPADISFIPVTEPFRFLVTVMLSASTTDRQALLAAERLFAAFPDEDAVAEASEEDIEALIHQAGLSHSKARNIKRSAEYIRQFGIPETEDGLVKLPGVGEKTAACYLVSILNKPGVIADTHFVRVARRLGLTDTDDRARSARRASMGPPFLRPASWRRDVPTGQWPRAPSARVPATSPLFTESAWGWGAAPVFGEKNQASSALLGSPSRERGSFGGADASRRTKPVARS